MRIVAFGPSEMYGHGLADCISSTDSYLSGPEPSKLAYPNLVATALNCECLNLSKPGSASLDILIKILNFSYQEDDIVLVQWPSLGTVTLVSENNNLINIHPWMAEEPFKILKHAVGSSLMKYQADMAKLTIYEQMDIAKNFYKSHSDKHLSIINWLYMDHAALHLNRVGIRKIFAGGDSWNIEDSLVPDHRDFYNCSDFLDFTADGHHPGPLWHNFIASKILKLI